MYQEAKSNGFDVKIIREVIRLRKQDLKERDELDISATLELSMGPST